DPARPALMPSSHITSPTALILPIEAICRRAQERGIRVCIDGPHALAAVPVEIDRLECDFYCASGNKWLSAPFGSGFLYVHPRWKPPRHPVVLSWGNSLSGRPRSWQDEFVWSGTRDPSPFLAVPAAIDFLAEFGPCDSWETRVVSPPPAESTGTLSGGVQRNAEPGVETRLGLFRPLSRGFVERTRHKITAIT